jgi:hypothetical protein
MATRSPHAANPWRAVQPEQSMLGRPSLRDEPLSTEPVDKSVDCLAPKGAKSRPYCIFVTMVKK